MAESRREAMTHLGEVGAPESRPLIRGISRLITRDIDLGRLLQAIPFEMGK
jgi:hypothetical protein